ncbi:MAG: GMC family oxidoreductase [Polyangiaceae bacterium]|nr:GMC family oxidoreductase [Polyangiaceae bacterium]
MITDTVPLKLRRKPARAAATTSDAPSAATSTAPAARIFGDRARRVADALAAAAIPEGKVLEGGGRSTTERLERYLSTVPRSAGLAYAGALWTLEAASLPLTGRPFSALPVGERQRLLERWEKLRSPHLRNALRALLVPMKFVHFDRPEMFAAMGCRYTWPTVRDEEPRWLGQVQDGRQVTEDSTVECDVVVVGTGAGGAAVAYELAQRGRAVVMLEEGDFHRRSSFDGRPAHAYHKLYRDHGLTMALGNVGIPIWTGRSVGGTTTINSGTCYRTPERTLAGWRSSFGLPSVFSDTGLDPYFARVEAMLAVTAANPAHVGKVGEVIARGAERLGYRHGVLRRNAPDCDGQGVCTMGCPTGAKRSTDVSYVPEALKRGAFLYTGARVERVDLVAGRARGVTVRLRSGHTLTVRASAVVVAAGTFQTPLLLRRSGVGRTSHMLGKNLSVHPATRVMALFDERIDMSSAIPQGYCVEEFAEQGIMFEGGSTPLNVTALNIPWSGPRFMDLVERYPHLATFGFMVKDESRGEVRTGPGGKPLLFYNLCERDLARVHQGLAILCEIYQAAGAKRVLPLVAGWDEVSTPAELERFRRARLRPGDLEMAAFHPLGTCRMGSDPGSSCIGPDHEVHDAAGLYVCDGSALPSSLGVNPQITIMALGLRAAEIIDGRLG